MATKEEGHHLSENEDELRSMFDNWAERYNKVYSSEKEREDQFSIFLFEMRDTNNTDGLDESAKLGYESLVGWGEPYPDTLTKMSPEELKKMRVEFEKWTVKHGKVYASEEEREKRLMIFWKNKSETEEFLKREVAVDVDKDMDTMWWEFSPDSPGYEPECCSFSPCDLNNDEQSLVVSAKSPVALKSLPYYGWINEDEEQDPDDIIILTPAAQIASENNSRKQGSQCIGPET